MSLRRRWSNQGYRVGGKGPKPFFMVATDLSEAAAQQVFASVINRRQGGPRKTRLSLTDRLLLFFEENDRSLREAAALTYEWGFGQSIEANEKRLHRLVSLRK